MYLCPLVVERTLFEGYVGYVLHAIECMLKRCMKSYSIGHVECDVWNLASYSSHGCVFCLIDMKLCICLEAMVSLGICVWFDSMLGSSAWRSLSYACQKPWLLCFEVRYARELCMFGITYDWKLGMMKLCAWEGIDVSNYVCLGGYSCLGS